jgi:hypothetical protein
MSEVLYDSLWASYFKAAGITPDKDPMSLRSVIKTILGNLNAVGAGGMLSRTTYAPTTADAATPIVSSTGLTSLNFTTGVDQPITFTVPTSGSVLVRMTCFVKGGAAAGTSVVLGITSNAHTSSPGTVVGSTGLVYLTPTATAADNGSNVCYAQVVTGLTAATLTTWYPAAMYSGTAPSIIAQGPTGQTTVPTGAPFIMEVWAA